MDAIKVSIVVPIYNVEEYVEECINSLIGQTLSDIEILLIDDGSTDSSGLICDKYAQAYEHIRVIHKTNNGLGSARNVGFCEARGKYVYFIDSDDLLDIDALRVLYEEAEQSSLDIILFSAECFGEDGEIEYNVNQYKRTAFLNETKSGADMFFSLYRVKEYYPSIPLRFYRREYLKCNKFLFPENIIHEDEAYGCLSLIQAKKVKCMAAPFYKRRYRKGSIMTSKKAYYSAMGYMHAWKYLVKVFDSLKLSKDYQIKFFEFVNGYIYRIIELYFSSFSREDKCRFRVVRKNVRDNLEYQELKAYLAREIRGNLYNFELFLGVNIFLFSPNMYKCCLRIFKLLEFSRRLPHKIRQGFILVEAIFKLFIVHHICVDKEAIILIGTPSHGNLGDQAIVYAEQLFFLKFKKKINIVEITSKLYLKHKSLLERIIYTQDLIIIDGGGSMGTLWINNEYRFRDVIQRFAQNRVFIFPQTAYFSEDVAGMNELRKSVEIYAKHKKLVIFCRDKATFEMVRKEFHCNESYYVPDMVLSLQLERYENGNRNRSGILLCLREDKEGTVPSSVSDEVKEFAAERGYKVKRTSTLTGGYIDKFNRKKELQRKWDEFSRSKLVITDRLHAMLFCAITGTPCIAFDNVSKKVSGGYDWLRELSFISLIYKESIQKEVLDNIIAKVYEKKHINLESEFKRVQMVIEGRN